MSTSFDDRKNAFENKFAHDQQLQFRAEARTAKMFGAWVAGELGLSGAEADIYARAMVEANLHEPGPADMIRRAQTDLTGKGITHTDTQLAARIEAFNVDAKNQVMAETEKNGS